MVEPAQLGWSDATVLGIVAGALTIVSTIILAVLGFLLKWNKTLHDISDKCHAAQDRGTKAHDRGTDAMIANTGALTLVAEGQRKTVELMNELHIWLVRQNGK